MCFKNLVGAPTQADDGMPPVLYPFRMIEDETLTLEPNFPVHPPARYVEALVRNAGTSFYWGMRFLEPARRKAMFAVYAFCRAVDDIADGQLSSGRKQNLLQAWQSEIAKLYRATPTHPITQALVVPVCDYGLLEEDFLAVIDGMRLDARDRVRIRDTQELNAYCDKVACAVGRLSVRIFGMERGPGNELALHLGMGLQLTNILRDIAEDAALDRIYLPAEELREFGAEGDGIEDALTAPGLPALCEGIANRAASHFSSAQHVMLNIDNRQIRPAKIMMAIYSRVLARLRVRGWRTLNVPVGPNKVEKLLISFRYGLLS